MQPTDAALPARRRRRQPRSPRPPRHSPPRARRGGGATSPGQAARRGRDEPRRRHLRRRPAPLAPRERRRSRDRSLPDPRLDFDGEIERRGADLLEPEAELLDEVEGEAIASGRAGRDHGDVELHGLAGLDPPRKRSANAVPDDRVPERVEPVVRELDAFPAARAPRCRPGVLEPQLRTARDAGMRLVELVGEPADGEWTHGYGVLADTLHREG